MRQSSQPVPAAGSGNQLSADTYTARITVAHNLLKACRLCECNCGVNRMAGERGLCGLDHRSHLYKSYLSGNEEPELLPALRLFFGGCNLRCSFCDEAPEAFDATCGDQVRVKKLAQELTGAVQRGIRTISVLGGEPSLHVHTLLELAAHAPGHLPLALNTNLYMSPVVLELLDGVVDWYLADFKFGNDACAQRIADVSRYSTIVRRNLLDAASRTHVIVRHVLLPGHLGCCLRPIVDWCATNLPGQRFELYTGYVPCNMSDTELGRFNTLAEVTEAVRYVREAGLQPAPPAGKANLPVQPRSMLAGHGDLTITLGANGKLYCHDLPHEFATLLGGFQTPPPSPVAKDGATHR
jgi:putative pyruvate formate lyase activating enzyme